MLIFNSEHDICLANGSENFQAPESARRFSEDCVGIMRFTQNDVSPEHKVWGWDKIVYKKLLRMGASLDSLPSRAYLDKVRELSHRRYAAACHKDVLESLSKDCSEYLCDTKPKELFSFSEVEEQVALYYNTILKAPWSGSGKGLRKIRSDSWTQSDKGWVEKTIRKQGSVMLESRQEISIEFSMQFRITPNESEKDSLKFVGFAIFETIGGAYVANLLASNEKILSMLSSYVPINVILSVKDAVQSFLERNYLGHYVGVLGVDMFITKEGKIAPCVEINVRNNMGMLSREFYDAYLSSYGESADGVYKLRVLNAPTNSALRASLSKAKRILTTLTDKSLYAVAVFDSDED